MHKTIDILLLLGLLFYGGAAFEFAFAQNTGPESVLHGLDGFWGTPTMSSQSFGTQTELYHGLQLPSLSDSVLGRLRMPSSLSYSIAPKIWHSTTSGVIASGNGFTLGGGSQYDEFPTLMTRRSAAFNLGWTSGRFSANITTSATKYMGMPLFSANQFGVAGNASYHISNAFSVTMFGQWYNNVPFVNLAAYPYLNTSRYGGYMTLMGNNVGVEVGAERYYQPMTGRWETAPIVTPIIRIGRGVYIGIPVGGAIKGAIDYSRMRNAPLPTPLPSW